MLMNVNVSKVKHDLSSARVWFHCWLQPKPTVYSYSMWLLMTQSWWRYIVSHTGFSFLISFSSPLLSALLAIQQQEQDPTNLYISNLPVSMDEQELENMLKPLGHVISTRILRDANGVSRGVGFARYIMMIPMWHRGFGSKVFCLLSIIHCSLHERNNRLISDTLYSGQQVIQYSPHVFCV